MAGVKKDRLVLVAAEHVCLKLTGILAGAGIEPDAAVHTGEAALDLCAQDGALVLTTFCLADMAGADMAEKLGEKSDVLMIVPQGFAEAVPGNVLTLRNPLSPDALVQAVRATQYGRGRMLALCAKAEKLERTLEERKVIDRAKGRLMDTFHMTEAQAHHHIQKKSMDTGRRIVDVAREILDAEQLDAL